jgi:hypothetical protein
MGGGVNPFVVSTGKEAVSKVSKTQTLGSEAPKLDTY